MMDVNGVTARLQPYRIVLYQGTTLVVPQVSGKRNLSLLPQACAQRSGAPLKNRFFAVLFSRAENKPNIWPLGMLRTTGMITQTHYFGIALLPPKLLIHNDLIRYGLLRVIIP